MLLSYSKGNQSADFTPGADEEIKMDWVTWRWKTTGTLFHSNIVESGPSNSFGIITDQ